MKYKYLFWLVIGLIIGYIFKINNIEGFKDLVGCSPAYITTLTPEPYRGSDFIISNNIDNNCNVDRCDGCNRTINIKILDYSLSEAKMNGVRTAFFINEPKNLTDEEKTAFIELINVDNPQSEQFYIDNFDVLWEDRFNTINTYLKYGVHTEELRTYLNILGVGNYGSGIELQNPLGQNKRIITSQIYKSRLYQEWQNNEKKALFIPLRDAKIRIDFIYGNINRYIVYMPYGGGTSEMAPIISNTFTEDFKTFYNLYDKDNPNIYITFQIIPDNTLKLNKDKIKSFIYNSLIEYRGDLFAPSQG